MTKHKKLWAVRKHYFSADAWEAQERIKESQNISLDTWDCICGAVKIPQNFNCPFCGMDKKAINLF